MKNFMLIELINNLFYLYNLLIFARIISSWFDLNMNNQLYNYLHLITEPVLGSFRNIFNSLGLMGAGIDFSPMAAIFALNFIKNFIIRLLLP